MSSSSPKFNLTQVGHRLPWLVSGSQLRLAVVFGLGFCLPIANLRWPCVSPSPKAAGSRFPALPVFPAPAHLPRSRHPPQVEIPNPVYGTGAGRAKAINLIRMGDADLATLKLRDAIRRAVATGSRHSANQSFRPGRRGSGRNLRNVGDTGGVLRMGRQVKEGGRIWITKTGSPRTNISNHLSTCKPLIP